MTKRIMLAALAGLMVVLLQPAPMSTAREESAFGMIIPDVPEGEESSYTVTFVDKEEKSFALDGDLSRLEEFSYKIHRYEKGGKSYYEVRERELLGGGLYTDFYTLFELGPYMRMLNYTETVHSYTGKVIRKHKSDYDDPLFDFPGPTILTHVITFWLRGIDFKAGQDATFYLMLFGDGSPPWRMHARIGPVEEVEVPAGKFSCYKVTIDPDYEHFLGKWAWAAFIIKPLVPDFFMWYSVEPPHPMVRFEGALGVKGITAIQIHELKSYSVP